MTVDKLDNPEDAKKFLRGLGLHIDEGVVRQVMNFLSGKAHGSLYSLYATRPGMPPSLCGKGTVYKIKKLYDKGELKPYSAYLSLWPTVGEAKIEQIEEAEQKAPKEVPIEQRIYVETPHKQEESLIVHGLSPGATDVEFLVTNMSNNLLVVDRVCVEVMHWEQYDARLTTGARIIDYKYKVKVNPNFIGEIPVRAPKFSYARGDVESFSFSSISPPGNKYIVRINFQCSDLETGKRFTVSTDKFEIRFYKHRIVSGEGTSSIHDAIAQAQKLIDEAKKKR